MEDIQIEGELKRIKNFFSSSRDVYRVEGSDLQIKKINKGADFEWRIKYDLKMYSLRLSKSSKDVFYLEPNS